ncbi:MAG: beta-lactamase family protein [bacterium]|nr:beta-lactamase family protein [bacterium]
MISRLFLLIVLFHLGNIAFAQYKSPIQLVDGWKVNHLDSVGINSTPINHLLESLEQKKDHKIHSLLIIRDGELLLESYFNNQEPDQQHDLRSATKSVISILMGIAIDEGFVGGVNDPISKYLSDHYDFSEDKSSIRINHLLTMSTGMDCNDGDKSSKGQEDKVYKKKNWIQYTLDLPMINDPAEVSKYCSMGTVLAAEIIEKSSGMSFPDFAQKYLFDPLGIKSPKWGHTSKKSNIPSSAFRLYLKSRDFAKIAQLIINNGNWNDQQIVSSEWIQNSTSHKTELGNIPYGYLWWQITYQTPYGLRVGITARGNGGQYLMIFPKDELAFVFTGGAYNSPEAIVPFRITNQLLLPLFSH